MPSSAARVTSETPHDPLHMQVFDDDDLVFAYELTEFVEMIFPGTRDRHGEMGQPNVNADRLALGGGHGRQRVAVVSQDRRVELAAGGFTAHLAN